MSTELNIYDYANIFSTYIDENGYEFFNLGNSVNIGSDIDASLYTYDHVYTFADWYALSYKHYATTRLWWVILAANQITNPFDITSGQRVKILNKNVISNILSQINNQ